MNKQKIGKAVGIIIIGIILLVTILSCITIVPAGHTGIVTTFGAVGDNVLTEGLHFKIPFVQNVIQMNNRTQKIETDGTASSKDLQIVSYVVAVNYRVDNASSAILYKNVGSQYSNVVISPTIQESIKAVSAQFTAEQLITERQQVSDQIKEVLSEKIGGYGIVVEIFNIVNFDFSEEFNNAVEAKQTAQQNALKAEQDLARIEVEAQQKITQAEAEAKSIELIQNALATSPDYIEYIKWNKWDGKLPSVMGDSELLIGIDNVVDTSSSSPEE